MLIQYGVLPVRVGPEGEPEVLLITSRDTGRWVVPRGNTMPGKSPAESAAVEAFEEAGIRGPMETQAFGAYRYEKRRRRGDLVPAEVHLFLLRVEEEASSWPEQAERERQWFTPDAAAAAVHEPELAALIRRSAAAVTRDRPGRESYRLPPPVSARAAPHSGGWTMNILKAIMPKEERFFDLFERHAVTMVSGADAMVAMFTGQESIEESCKAIARHEHDADDVTRNVLVAVRRSFITPFDRSAITALISSMDDAVDEMWKTAKAITLYEVASFEPQMREIATLSAEAARLVAQALPLLRNIGRNGARLHEITEAVVHLEGRADDLHEAGLKALFQAHRGEKVMDFIVGREVYSHLERVLDRLEDVADEIQGIVIDHA